MRIETYDLTVQFDNGTITYTNISLVAVKRYLLWHRDNSTDYVDAVWARHGSLVTA